MKNVASSPVLEWARPTFHAKDRATPGASALAVVGCAGGGTLCIVRRADATRCFGSSTPRWSPQAPSVLVLGDDVAATRAASVHWLSCPQVQGWLDLGHAPPAAAVAGGPTLADGVAAALAAGYCEADAVVLAALAQARLHRRAAAARHRAVPGERDGVALCADDLPTLRDAPTTVRGFAPLTDPALGVYAVVDSAAWVARVLAAGIRTVQLRIKDPAEPTLVQQVIESVALARATPGAQLFINDHWRLALAHGAYGVHLGQDDVSRADLAALQAAGLRLGLSTHSYWEVARAWALRPSYIACGPVYATQSKAMPWRPQGLGNLRFWARQLPLPVVGIGGIGVPQMAAVAATGVAGAAVLSAITQADDASQACQALLRQFARR